MEDADRRRLEAVVDDSPFVLFQADTRLDYLYANARFRELTGLTEAECRGRGWLEGLEAEALPALLEIARHPGEAERVPIDLRFRHRSSGKLRWASGWLTPLRDEAGVLTGVTGSLHDATHERLVKGRLREREQRLASIFGNDHTMMLVTDPETGAILDANPAAERFYGCSAEELTRMRVWDISTDPREVALEKLASARAGLGKLFPLVHRTRGGPREVEVRPTPMRFEGRDLLFVVIEDVTGRKRMQDAFHASERRYRHLVESSPDGMFVEVEGRFAYLNPRAVEMFGAQDAGDLLGREVLDLVHEDYREIVRRRQHDVREQGSTPLSERVYLRLDGSELEIEAAARLTDFEGKPGAMVILRDVSARHRAEEKALWADAVVEGTNAAVVGIGVDGRILSWNQAAERLFGHTAEEALGHVVTGSSVVEGRLDGLLERIRGGETLGPVRMRLPAADGREFDAEAHLSVVRSRDDEVLGMSAIVRDVSAERQLERAKDDFVAIASHELRTPLTTILGYATLLQRKDRYDERRTHRFAERIRGEAEHMRKLVERMLQVLVVDASPFEIERGWVDIEALVTKCVEGLPIDERERVLVEAPSLDVCCDISLLGMAISNLVSNALKFSDPPSIVTVRAEEAPAELLISVADEGVGIEASELEHVFERFHQADMSSTRGFGGFGLGLYIVKRIVEAHGATIDVASEPGQGTTFTIHLPLLERCSEG